MADRAPKRATPIAEPASGARDARERVARAGAAVQDAPPEDTQPGNGRWSN